MTTEEIMALTGADLDVAVAEYVMVLVPRLVRVRGGTETVTVYGDNLAIRDGWWSAAELHQHGAPPQYHANIAAAFQVINKLHADGFGFNLRRHEDSEWVATVTQGDLTNGEIGEATAETAAEAISKAALLTLLGPGRRGE